MIFRLKQLFFWIVYRLDQRLPKALGVAARNRCWPGRLVLDAVELHLVDRCNMNCAGCSHFSPFAPAWQADVETIVRDLTALKAKFVGGIRHVNLLGGEPFLHPNLCGIIARVKEVCPDALVTVVTNGLTIAADLSRMGTRSSPGEDTVTGRFLQVCRQCGVRVKWTMYPPLADRRAEFEALFRQAGVEMRVEAADEFWARMVPTGTVDSKRAFRFCRAMMYCPYLREGRLYRCAQECHLRDFIREVRQIGASAEDYVPAPGLDVHSTTLTGKDILSWLMTPGPSCRYCADHVRTMAWRRGGDITDTFLEKEACACAK